jgi:hypothetical protein
MPIEAEVFSGVEPEGVTPEEEEEPTSKVVPDHNAQKVHIKIALAQKHAISHEREVTQSLLNQQGNATAGGNLVLHAKHVRPILQTVGTVVKRGTFLRCVDNPSSKKLHREVQPYILRAIKKAS